MVVMNGIAALWLVPSWILVFKPAFVAKLYQDEDGIIHQLATSSLDLPHQSICNKRE
jgi:hypothetical protein